MALLFTGCVSVTQVPPTSFALPPGDILAGKHSFLELKCFVCHQVVGDADVPAPTADPPVPVRFGAPQASRPTDERLVTAIINPDHRLAQAHHPERVSQDGHSRMLDYSDVMTVRELINLVAYLRSLEEQKP